MFAIVEVAGQQFKVEKNQNIFVHRLDEKEGNKIVFDKVLLIENNNGTALVGTPVVKGYQIKATVLAHLKGDKVKVFKKKRRKGYQVKNGHRQLFTEIHIDAIEKSKTPAKKAADEGEVHAEKSVKTKKASAPATKTKNKAAAKPEPKKTATVIKETEAKSSTAKTTKPKAKKATATKKAEATKPNAAAKPKTTAKKTEPKEKTAPEKDSDTNKEEK